MMYSYRKGWLFDDVVARVRCRGDHPPSIIIIRCGMSIYSGKYDETRNSLCLSGEKWNGSRHLVF